ncbi:MAG TPA: IS1595 family transposase [Syntrophales bacterium]|nr:IS1595 family transposase [Syntrophales bacterium]
MNADLTNPIFNDEEAARRHLEFLRWPNGPFCPHCGEPEKVTKIRGKSHRPGLYVCKSCRQHFTVTVGTIIEDSHIKLHKWLLAFHLMTSSKKGMSALQLSRLLDITYKSAWFMGHRIREAMKPENGGQLGRHGPVEADETFIGTKPGAKKRRGYAHKNAVFSLVERNGEIRSFHVANITADTLKPILKEQVNPEAHLMTDDAGQYRLIGPEFAKHEVVAHSTGEYVRDDVHTNTAEGFFSIFKRGIYGVYQHVSPCHLHRYTTEFDFRFNHRSRLGFNDFQRATEALKGITGKRLTYRRIDQKTQ